MKTHPPYSFTPWTLLSAVLLVILSWLATPAPASAHAKLVRTAPEAGSLLDAQPQEIQLYVSEEVGLEFSTVTLYDRARREQSLGALGRVDGDSSTVTAPIPGVLPPGIYTVVWRVLSTVDGHLTAGSFAFRVRARVAGTPAANITPEPEEPIVPFEGSPDTPFEGSAESPDPLRWLVRALILGASVLLLGGPLLSLAVIEPTVAKRGPEGKALWSVVGKRFGGIGTVAAIALLLSLALDMVMQIASIGDTDLAGAISRGDSFLLVINTTRYGFAWALKAIAALVLLGLMLIVWLWNKRSGSGLWEASIAAGSLLSLAQSLGSHAAAVANGDNLFGLPIPIVSDWLHLTTVATWIGGLGYMVLALFPAFRAAGMSSHERRSFLGDTIPRFSRLAILSVTLLSVTGTYNLLIHSTDLGAVLSSQYGQVLALKVALFALLIAFGAVNLRRLTPLLLKARTSSEIDENVEAKPVRQLRRNVRLEVLLGVGALLCAGGLTLLPPPSGASSPALAQGPVSVPTSTPPTVAVEQPPTPIPTPQPATAETVVAGYNFTLTTRPSLEGDELTLLISRVGEAAPPLTDVSKVLFKVTPQDIDGGSASYTAAPDGEAGADGQVWRATETILTLDGGYLVTAILQRTESPDVKVAFRLDLSVEYGLRATPAHVVDVRISTDPNPPKNGEVALTLTLVDGSRTPIEGATVSVSPFMPAHAHVEPTSVAVPVPDQPGAYSSKVEFDMGGAWLFIFNVEREGQPTIKTDASLEVIGPTATPKSIPRVTPAVSATPTSSP